METTLKLNTNIPFSQEKFLSNQNNKNNLIITITNKLQSEGFLCKRAPEDADVLIVNTAIQLAKQDKTVIIVGQDIDLLVLLHQLNSNGLDIYFHKPGSSNVKDSFYTSHCFKHEPYTSVIAFLHAFSGCDTTSSFAGKGKKTIVRSLLDNKNLLNLASVYYQKDADHITIAKNGSQLTATIYKSKKIYNSLNQLRFELYQQATNKSTFKLEKLPPTEEAAAQHSYRVYYQLQTWLGNFDNDQDNKKAKDWGWNENVGRLVPKYISDSSDLIPGKLLKSVSCTCESGCNNQRCGCRKHGLKCTNLCNTCTENCSNRDREVFVDLSDSEDIDEEPAKNNDIEIEEPENANDFEDNIEFESLIDEENEPQQKRPKID